MLRVKNPTAVPVEAIDPFNSHMLVLNLSHKTAMGDWEPYSLPDYQFVNWGDGSYFSIYKRIWILSGQVLEQRVCLDGGQPTVIINHPWVDRLVPGLHRLEFGYLKQATANILVKPSLAYSGYKSIVFRELKGPVNGIDGGPEGCFVFEAVAIKTSETTVITRSAGIVYPCPQTAFQEPSNWFGFSARLGESEGNIRNLDLKRLEDGRVRVSWIDAKEKMNEVVLAPPGLSEKENGDEERKTASDRK